MRQFSSIIRSLFQSPAVSLPKAARCAVGVSLALLALTAITPQAHAQRSGDFGMTYTQQRSKFLGGSNSEYFMLRGATVDLGYNLWKGIGVTGSATGLASSNLLGSIDIHQVEFAVGPRYTYNLGRITPTTWARRGGIFVQGKVGYTIATSGVYPVNGVVTSNASALTYTGGGGINVHIYQRFDLRLIQAEYVQTRLPNGGTNQQNSIRVGAGINVHLGN